MDMRLARIEAILSNGNELSSPTHQSRGWQSRIFLQHMSRGKKLETMTLLPTVKAKRLAKP